MADLGLAAVDPDRLVKGTARAWAHLLDVAEQVEPGNATLRSALPDLLDADPPQDADPLAELTRTQEAIGQELRTLLTDPARPHWRTPVPSPVGTLPRVTYLHASAYRAAVATLDLLDEPEAADEAALDAGVVAFVDVLGAICKRNGANMRVAVRTERLDLSLDVDDSGWRLGQDCDGLPVGSG